MERIGDAVERELARSGSRDAIPLAAITAAWPEVVGDAVARNAWPRRLGKDGTLHVATAAATWAHELDLLQEDVVAGLRRRLGTSAPSRVRFAPGPIPDPPSASGTASAATVVSATDVPPEIEREATLAVAEIEDEELRELVARAARASLLKARSGRSFW